MGEELKIAAYALSSTGKELNLDNMYVNGRYMNVGSDSKSVINKVSHADFQLYGVCDSEIGVEDNRELGTANSNLVMQMMQRLQTTLTDVGKIEKERIWDTLVDTNRALKKHKNEVGRDEMGSSFAGLFLHGNRGLAVHLGDSRIYVVRGGRMLQITDDHLESSDMYRLGVISQPQAEVHKRSSHLTAYLGMDDIYDARDEAFSKYFVFYPGDTFIICTDGVSDAVANEELERMVRLLKDASVDTLAAMMMKAAANNSQEDMTIMILRVEEAPGEAPKRGTSTIPRRENFEKNPQPDEEDDMDRTRKTGGLLSKLPKAIRKTEPEGEEDYEELSEDTVSDTPRVSQHTRPLPRIDQDPDDPDYDEEEEDSSLLDRLLSDKKRLAMVIGGAVIVIVLLIIIIVAFGKDDDKPSNSSQIHTESSVTPDSSTAPDSSLPNQDSSQPADNSDASGAGTDSSVPNDNSSSTDSSAITTEQSYTIEEGDYFYSIVLNFYDSSDLELMEAFAAYNGMTLESDLQPGMVLKVPPKETLLNQ